MLSARPFVTLRRNSSERQVAGMGATTLALGGPGSRALTPADLPIGKCASPDREALLSCADELQQ
jgi:hypothetical protein